MIPPSITGKQKVYIVQWGNSSVVGVYSTIEKAVGRVMKEMPEVRNDFDIRECEVDGAMIMSYAVTSEGEAYPE